MLHLPPAFYRTPPLFATHLRDTTLAVSFTYGSSAVNDEIGRLVGITRHGSTLEYEYDQFGRTTRDADLVFTYDDNGNRTRITYPDGLEVEYTFDYADREASLTADPDGENLLVVSAATYLPSGPLWGLTFGNGRSEDRAFTGRYFPQRITLEPSGGGSPLLDWEYTTDDVGNPTIIQDLVGSTDREYSYQEHQYYLTCAAGPWAPSTPTAAVCLPEVDGEPLLWTYDQIGNRVSEQRAGITDTYDYTQNSEVPPRNTALLASVNLAGGAGGTRDYSYTDAGHVTEVDAGANVVDFLVDNDGRLGGLERQEGDAGSSMVYDGRGFLSRVEGLELSALFRDGFERATTECWPDGVPTPPSPSSPCSPAFRIVEPSYDSGGLLHALNITDPMLGSSAERVLYLAGRPVAIARDEVGTLDLLYLTTDHLGTPIAACDDTGALQWSGGFEPFGADWLAGTSGGASENGVWPRFPGQWADPAWIAAGEGFSPYMNGFRWYENQTDRYQRPDPLGRSGDDNAFVYAYANPLALIDPLGLRSRACCTPITGGPQLLGTPRHCFIEVESSPGELTTYGLHWTGGVLAVLNAPFVPVPGCVFENDSFDVNRSRSPQTDCGDWSGDPGGGGGESCGTDRCVKDAAAGYGSPSEYGLVSSNSNTFAGTISRACGLSVPATAGTPLTPGWNDAPARPITRPGVRCPTTR